MVFLTTRHHWLNIDLHCMPPYCSNLNPIKRLRQVTNKYVRNHRYFTTSRAFRAAITQFFKTSCRQ
ncbi:transposase [Xenorhabdus khoisanae]|uniref:transposase n=1 Tax=Xenorhabdus khoisanae TaxID=880157 RepID=UPI003D6E7272